MKNILLLAAIMFLGSCANTPTTQSVIGIYGNTSAAGAFKFILMKNGELEHYKEGSRNEDADYNTKGDWGLVNGKLRITLKKEQKDSILTRTYRINPDGSILQVGFLINGKQVDIPKDEQPTYHKIK